MSNKVGTLDVIVANINDKITVLYDNESDKLDEILNVINENLVSSEKAYIKTVDKQKYIMARDNAVTLTEILSR